MARSVLRQLSALSRLSHAITHCSDEDLACGGSGAARSRRGGRLFPRDPHAHPSRAPVELVRLCDRRDIRPASLRRARCPSRSVGWRSRDVRHHPAPARARAHVEQRNHASLRRLPYLISRIGKSAVRHLALLPADWSREKILALARAQAEANRFETAAPRGRYAKREAITAIGPTEIEALGALVALLEARQVSGR
jgi:hypothetical protein